MAAAPRFLKFYRMFTKTGPKARRRKMDRRNEKRLLMAAGVAIAMFIALFGWGAGYFGWHDPSGKVQLALFTSFILGIIASYKSRG
jgi:hypothetical protein